MNGECGDMIDAGIPDPAKATRGAIENSASIAAMFLTKEALIADVPEEAPPPMPAGGRNGMGGMDGMMQAGSTPRKPAITEDCRRAVRFLLVGK